MLVFWDESVQVKSHSDVSLHVGSCWAAAGFNLNTVKALYVWTLHSILSLRVRMWYDKFLFISWSFNRFRAEEGSNPRIFKRPEEFRMRQRDSWTPDRDFTEKLTREKNTFTHNTLQIWSICIKNTSHEEHLKGLGRKIVHQKKKKVLVHRVVRV